MTVYAKGTSVSVAKTRAEIESMLTRYGASSFASGWDGPTAVIMFEAKGRRIRFSLPLPDPNDMAFTRDPRHTWKERSKAAAQGAYEAECRQRWRALALVIKAKLEAVESGIALFEDEFLANIVVPGGKTFGEWARPELARAYETGVGMPPLLGAGAMKAACQRGGCVGCLARTRSSGRADGAYLNGFFTAVALAAMGPEHVTSYAGSLCDEHALMAVTVLAGFAQLNNLEASFIEKLEATFPAMRTPSKEGSAKS
jgi:hypothetical protein